MSFHALSVRTGGVIDSSSSRMSSHADGESSLHAENHQRDRCGDEHGQFRHDDRMPEMGVDAPGEGHTKHPVGARKTTGITPRISVCYRRLADALRDEQEFGLANGSAICAVVWTSVDREARSVDHLQRADAALKAKRPVLRRTVP